MGRHVIPSQAERLAQRERIRSRMEAAIERLIETLDAMDGDPDLEPSLGSPERHPSHFATLNCRYSSQAMWADGGDADEREEEDEHGGDVLDEPHDRDPDEPNGDERDDDGDRQEPWLGAPELLSQPIAWACIGGQGNRDVEDVNGGSIA